jgi:hypothetical protein
MRLIDRVPSRAYPYKWISADVCDRPSLMAAVEGCTMLYNLGAEHLCAAAEPHRITRIVFTSTVAVYGASARELDNSSPLRPFNEYGRTKLQAEQVYREWALCAPDRSLTRPTVVFGPGNRGNVYTLLRKWCAGAPASLAMGAIASRSPTLRTLPTFYCMSWGSGPACTSTTTRTSLIRT